MRPLFAMVSDVFFNQFPVFWTPGKDCRLHCYMCACSENVKFKAKIMENREDDARRYPHNLQGLLRFAVDHSDDPQSGTASVFQEMNEEVKYCT